MKNYCVVWTEFSRKSAIVDAPNSDVAANRAVDSLFSPNAEEWEILSVTEIVTENNQSAIDRAMEKIDVPQE